MVSVSSKYLYSYVFTSLSPCQRSCLLQRLMTSQSNYNKWLWVLIYGSHRWNSYVTSPAWFREHCRRRWRKNAEQRVEEESCKHYFLGMIWLLYTWIPSTCGFLPKYLKILVWIRERLPRPMPFWGAIESWLLVGNLVSFLWECSPW